MDLIKTDYAFRHNYAISDGDIQCTPVSYHFLPFGLKFCHQQLILRRLNLSPSIMARV